MQHQAATAAVPLQHTESGRLCKVNTMGGLDGRQDVLSPSHALLQKPFRTEAPLLMDIFQQVFKGATAAELAAASAPVPMQRQPGQSRQASIARPKGDAERIWLSSPSCCVT